MEELQRRLLNKGIISHLFTDEWQKQKDVLYEYKIKTMQLRNEIDLKIRGVKVRVRICVFFEEAIPNGLPVKD